MDNGRVALAGATEGLVRPATVDADDVNSPGLLRTLGRAAYERAARLTRAERIDLLASCARGEDLTTSVTLYEGGTHDTTNGRLLVGTWREFGDFLVSASTLVVRKKGEGPWFTPAASSNGRCRDADIESISMLSFDCDGHGDWHVLREILSAAGVAFVLQRSSRHRPDFPKWHLHIPLARPWAGTKTMWRRIYRHCVGWFAGAAELSVDFDGQPPSYGFDHATDRLGQPWFPSARRAESDAAPETIIAEGGALELVIS